MEKLTSEEMRSFTGQTGIDFAADQTVFYHYADSIKIEDVGTRNKDGVLLTPDGYLRFTFETLIAADDEIFAVDVGLYDSAGQVEVTDQTSTGPVTRYLDHPWNQLAMVHLAQQTLGSPHYHIKMDDLSVYNHTLSRESLIGDLNIAGIHIHEAVLDLFPATGTSSRGIRGSIGMRAETGGIWFENPGQQMRAAFEGIMVGAAFTGPPLPEAASSTSQVDPGTWGFDTGMFQVGIPCAFHDDPDLVDTTLATHPFSIDFAGDDTRPGDFQTYILVNAPVKGSIRISSISSDNFDMGPVAIDGMRLYKHEIEFPGRGIGN
jgi:hypothetical protein